jgi:restriction system protein
MSGNMQPTPRRLWVVRLGEGGRYVDVGRRGGFAAIGWEELGDLTWLTDARESPKHLERRLTDLYRQTFGGSNVAIGQSASEIWNFVREIAPSDTVLLPDPRHKTVLPGTVVSGYRYVAAPNDGCLYPNRRDVTWHEDREFRRDQLSQRLRNTLGSLLAVFNVDAHSEELAPLVGPGPKHATGQELVRLLIDRIHDSFAPEAFEQFVTDVLGATGFQATKTRYVGDKGIDVTGILNAEGIAQVTLRVQVKRLKGRVGIDEVLKIRGTLDVDSQGAIVSLGGFTKQAQAEAESEQKKTIALIDGEALVDLLLRYWDELEPKYGAALRVRRREIPLTERFSMAVE